jgi:hypothetical protein
MGQMGDHMGVCMYNPGARSPVFFLRVLLNKYLLYRGGGTRVRILHAPGTAARYASTVRVQLYYRGTDIKYLMYKEITTCIL